MSSENTQPQQDAPAVEPAPAVVQPAPVVVPAVVVAPAPAVAAAEPKPAAVVAEEPKAAPAVDLAAKIAELEAARAADAKKLAELEAARAGDIKALRDARLDGLLDTVKVAPAYREFARVKLADVDPTTDEGRAKVDAFASAHPAMLDIPRPGSADASVASWMAEKAKAAPGSAWNFIPPSALSNVRVD